MNTPKLPPLPERDTSKPAEQQGVFRKFDVRRTDGSSEPGRKHHGCEYFVLDVYHDPAARAALKAYADAVEATHPLLAADMRERYAIAAIQAQASVVQQEPVAWGFFFSDGEFGGEHFDTEEKGLRWQNSDDCLWDGYIAPLYTHPAPQAKPPEDHLPDAGKMIVAKPQPLSAERTKALLFDHAVRKGLLTVHSERMASHDPSTRCSWLEGHAKACDISNEAAHGIKE